MHLAEFNNSDRSLHASGQLGRGDDQQSQQERSAGHAVELRWSEDLYRVRGRRSHCWRCRGKSYLGKGADDPSAESLYLPCSEHGIVADHSFQVAWSPDSKIILFGAVSGEIHAFSALGEPSHRLITSQVLEGTFGVAKLAGIDWYELCLCILRLKTEQRTHIGTTGLRGTMRRTAPRLRLPTRMAARRS